VFLNKFSAREMRLGRRLDLVIFQETDRTIHLKHGQRDIVITGNPMLAHGALQLIHADVLFGHVRADDLSVVNQQAPESSATT